MYSKICEGVPPASLSLLTNAHEHRAPSLETRHFGITEKFKVDAIGQPQGPHLAKRLGKRQPSQQMLANLPNGTPE